MKSKLRKLLSSLMGVPPIPEERSFFDPPIDRYVMPADQARGELETVINYLKYKQGYFTMKDLAPILKMTGGTREWLQIQIEELLENYTIFYDEVQSRYEILG